MRRAAFDISADRPVPCLESACLWCEVVGNIDLRCSGTPYANTATIIMFRDFCIAWCEVTGLDEDVLCPHCHSGQGDQSGCLTQQLVAIAGLETRSAIRPWQVLQMSSNPVLPPGEE